MSDKDSMDQHLQAGMYGTPKINPDEQRHYLGTFRERVSLAMTVGQVITHDYLNDYRNEITAHPEETVILNGHIDQNNLVPYMKIASQSNVKFTIVSDDIYGHAADDIGLVVASNHAINVHPINVEEKYADRTEAAQTSTGKKAPHKFSLRDIFHHNS
ncbi:YueI family protein [Levilactobacillus bambusae]|uniref:DUF1694 domain-containing protein n=1 Tax=Levilactobacillus bambusae TaxID=2024736 RepID=A0A2V1MXI0_9LACO|nr:YueI family protein [Levilactobacillus bambusae]PWF99551.1 DUF1694 domain-containing protein [Levilactobacillus bambusae]